MTDGSDEEEYAEPWYAGEVVEGGEGFWRGAEENHEEFVVGSL